MFIEQGRKTNFLKSIYWIILIFFSLNNQHHYFAIAYENGNSWSLISYGNDAMMFLNQILRCFVLSRLYLLYGLYL
jgi:hypothetical protein